MRPQRCVQDHELVWLTSQLAVCPACADDSCIYHDAGAGTRLVRFLRRTVRAGAGRSREHAHLGAGASAGIRGARKPHPAGRR